MSHKATMILLIVSLIIAGPLGYVIVQPNPVQKQEDYWTLRAKFLKNEENRMLGGDLDFEVGERSANEVLMRAKFEEIDNACKDPSKFLPSQSFFQAENQIRESKVFQIIQSMPKGAILHAHDTGIVSWDYVFHNITHRTNLYACIIDQDLKLKFFEKPDDDCDWQLLENLRKTDGNNVDSRIREKLLMNTQQPDAKYPTVNDAWKKFMSIFAFTGSFLTYRPVFEEYYYQGLLEFYNDNVQYLEMRTVLPTLYDLNGTKYENVEVAKIYKKITERFMRDHPDFVGVKLIYAPLRNCKKIQFEDYLKIARQLKKELPNFIAGFDLVGQEEKGKPLSDFALKLRALGDDVQLFFHAGETNWYGTSTDENLIDAVLLNTKRIGHGFALLKHPIVLDMVKRKKIAIEVNPISNQVLTLIKDLRNHPSAALFADNYPIVVSNDDPGLWSAKGLSYDYYQAFVGIMSRNADLRALKKLALNSIEYSTLNETQKIRAQKIWKERWTKFVNELSK